MKKMIKASRTVYSDAAIKARGRKILAKADELFDLLDSSSEDVFEEYELNALYEELNSAIYEMAHKLSKTDPLYNDEDF